MIGPSGVTLYPEPHLQTVAARLPFVRYGFFMDEPFCIKTKESIPGVSDA